jgi:tripartite-type tricarboxylate transporter receptor subunit TctC
MTMSKTFDLKGHRRGTSLSLCVALALMATPLTARAVLAQDAAKSWPDRPVHFIIPFPAGSSSDIVGRIVAQKLSERLHQQFVVDNRGGASGNLGTEAVAHAAPDGYTIGLANTSTHTVSPNLMVKQTYDPVKDFVAVSMLGASPFVLGLYPGVAAKNVQELIAIAKSKPGKLTFAEAGPATLANLTGVLFAKMANVDMTGVAYRVDMQFGTIPPTLPLIRQSKLRALGVTSAKRNSALPDVPTIAEQGLPGYESVLWQGIVAPAHMSPAIVQRLNGEITAALHDSDVVASLTKLGVEPMPSTPDEFAAVIRNDLKKWHDVIVSANIHPE